MRDSMRFNDGGGGNQLAPRPSKHFERGEDFSHTRVSYVQHWTGARQRIDQTCRYLDCRTIPFPSLYVSLPQFAGQCLRYLLLLTPQPDDSFQSRPYSRQDIRYVLPGGRKGSPMTAPALLKPQEEIAQTVGCKHKDGYEHGFGSFGRCAEIPKTRRSVCPIWARLAPVSVVCLPGWCGLYAAWNAHGGTCAKWPSL